MDTAKTYVEIFNMNFRSDNTSGIADRVLEEIRIANDGYARPYGADDVSNECLTEFQRSFGDNIQVFSVATGTAANAVSLATQPQPYGGVICNEWAHINRDEAGAPEWFAHGLKLIPVQGVGGKVQPERVLETLGNYNGSVHETKPTAISISQPTEWGECYTLAEIRTLSSMAKSEGMLLHMDGARLGNAICHLGCSPKEVTSDAGVDALSLGLTKSGAMAAEAVVIFSDEFEQLASVIRKRSGHLLSKSRFMAAQFRALLKNSHWLELCLHANLAASKLAQSCSRIEGVDVVGTVESNLVFLRLPSKKSLERLLSTGATFLSLTNDEKPTIRLVTSFCTTDDEVIEFVENLALLAKLSS